ncbi:MAG: hypothetical protein IPN75_15195 [Dechloromonas sp.]|uniref:Uncharacterized protein n=1 Tax=Candidatus Dechloromonas phosphorivorans TaxID=2899244 RepID=A0A9D7QMC1_9RHOO|nr:hypothetical protein [Candidatus Dechloromonas phosphorivorans]
MNAITKVPNWPTFWNSLFPGTGLACSRSHLSFQKRISMNSYQLLASLPFFVPPPRELDKLVLWLVAASKTLWVHLTIGATDAPRRALVEKFHFTPKVETLKEGVPHQRLVETCNTLSAYFKSSTRPDGDGEDSPNEQKEILLRK